MNVRIAAAQIVAVAGIVACFASGCAVAPEGSESTESSSEALKSGSPGLPPVHLVCGAAEAFDSSAFEQGLAALGCSPKQAYAPNGVDAWFETTCPTAPTAHYYCQNDGVWVTGNADLLWLCFDNYVPPAPAPPFDLTTLTADHCTGTQAASGYEIFGWDPNCTGGACPHITY